MGIEVLLKFYYCHCYTWNSLAKYQHILHSKIISVHDIMLNDSVFFYCYHYYTWNRLGKSLIRYTESPLYHKCLGLL